MVLPSSSFSRSSKPEDLLRRRAVEVAGRLVGDDQRRIGDQRARDRDALLLAAGQLVRVVRPSRSARPTSASAVATRSRRSRRDSDGELQRQLDVLERGQHRHQVVELEDEADVRGAPRGELAVGQLRDVDAGHADLSRRSACRCRRSG